MTMTVADFYGKDKKYPERRDPAKRMDRAAENWWKEGYRSRVFFQYGLNIHEQELTELTNRAFLKYCGRKAL